MGTHFRVAGQPQPPARVKLSDLNFDRIGLSGAFQPNPLRISLEKKSNSRGSSSNSSDFQIGNRIMMRTFEERKKEDQKKLQFLEHSLD